MMIIYGMTDIGMVRKENQDAYDFRTDFPSGHMAAVVCDGMGGPAGGQLASSIAVRTYMDCLERLLQPGMGVTEAGTASAEAVEEANLAVWKAAQELGYASMGTTLVSAIVCGEEVVVTNVGDSRAYYLHQGKIFRVTRDHSLVQNMIERGELTEEEARVHPQRNLITRALGPEAGVACDRYALRMAPESSLLLCSDGLMNTATDREISEIVRNLPAARCPAKLISLARSRGAPDNVTVVLARNSREGGDPS